MSPLNEHGQDVLSGALEPLTANELSRRRMLQIMGASLALATASGCRWEGEEILPFTTRPDGRIPGRTRQFATALECGGVAASLLVTSYDGRPIKIEGNPEHSLDAGACSARSQAALLDLYDPDHSSGLVQQHEQVAHPRTWKEFDPWFAARAVEWRAARGARLRVLAEPTSSLAVARERARFAELFPEARWVEWEPVSAAQARAGAELAFGRALRVLPQLTNARTVVCLDADLVGDHPSAIANARALARQRDPSNSDPVRVWCVESTPSLTGAFADERLALRHEQVFAFLAALEQRVYARLGAPAPAGTAPSGGFLETPRVKRWLDHLAEELVSRRGAGFVAVGAQQPALVHALAHRLDATLGNAGKTSVLLAEDTHASTDSVEPLAALVAEIGAGAVDTLVILGGNPLYDAPADVDFARALRSVPSSLHLAETWNETGRACTWHLPRAHALETWGDASSLDGTRCITQPLVDRIHERRSVLEFVAALNGTTENARVLVRNAVAPGASEDVWKRCVHDGFVAGSAATPVAANVRAFEVPTVQPRALESELADGRLELVFAADAKVYDGRSANNAWLQELPDAITKIAWGNAARFAPATAAALGIVEGDLITLRTGGRELDVAATLVPGQALGTITLHLGYGRRAAGLVGGLESAGIESIGFDAYRLRTRATLASANDLAVRRTGKTWPLARTQDPQALDAIGAHGREERLDELLRESDRTHGDAHGAHAAHGVGAEHASLWQRAEPGAVRWGMAIDLNSCTGCNACVVACQSENNVPVVGREQVLRGREMHWIRVDRWFRGSDEAPRIRFQPITCQQCESAPCEQVCPVAATVHSAEGLNDMVYNRCVGTRYCANNCPFKVRRFNYFDYNRAVAGDGAEVQRMRFNPDVTIRPRGVMEKCTYCVQRIQGAKIQAKNAGRAVRDGEVVPACAQTCPTNAIAFGDLADPESRVSKLRADPRAYTLLDELNLRARTNYLARVTNRTAGEARDDG